MGEITREKELFFSPAASQWDRAILRAKFKFCTLYWIFQEVLFNQQPFKLFETLLMILFYINKM